MILRRKVGIVILVAITFILNSVAETTHTQNRITRCKLWGKKSQHFEIQTQNWDVIAKKSTVSLYLAIMTFSLRTATGNSWNFKIRFAIPFLKCFFFLIPWQKQASVLNWIMALHRLFAVVLTADCFKLFHIWSLHHHYFPVHYFESASKPSVLH